MIEAYGGIEVAAASICRMEVSQRCAEFLSGPPYWVYGLMLSLPFIVLLIIFLHRRLTSSSR